MRRAGPLESTLSLAASHTNSMHCRRPCVARMLAQLRSSLRLVEEWAQALVIYTSTSKRWGANLLHKTGGVIPVAGAHITT
mmetsp:Transcript_70983/g.170029  ORF Transcript_70983/g.170029 Transcript_70983/m.170029 type:complete len:81 (+) Transcript_70983:476-718(+)